MTDQSNENTKTGDKTEKREQLSPAKAGENQIAGVDEFSRAFQRAHEHDNTLSGTHDTALEILDGATTLVSSRVVSQTTDTSSEAYLKTITNPAADALYEIRKNIDKLPCGTEKEKALTEARSTQKELFPASYERLSEDNDGGTFKALNPDSAHPFSMSNRPDGGVLIETGIENRQVEPPPNFMTAMTPLMKAEIIRAFQNASAVADRSLTETNDDILKQTAEGYINAVKFPVDVTVAACKGLWGILEFERDLMIDRERANSTAASAGDSIGKALVAGVELWVTGSEYAHEVSQHADYGRPFQDLGNAINQWYDGLSPGDQMHVMAEISGGFGIGAAAGQLRQLAKPGAFVEFMEEVAQSVPKNVEAQTKAAQSIKDIIQSFSKNRLTPALEASALDAGAGTQLGERVNAAVEGMKNRFDELHHKMTGDAAFRGEHEPFSPINCKTGLAKSFINEAGDLTPADPIGLFKGKPVDVVHHLCGSFYKYHKQCSPFTSFSETGEILLKYGQKYKITADLKAMEKAIATGDLTDVEIIPHKRVLQMITDSPCAPYSKKLAMSYATRDREILIRGVIPKRFFTFEELYK